MQSYWRRAEESKPGRVVSCDDENVARWGVAALLLIACNHTELAIGEPDLAIPSVPPDLAVPSRSPELALVCSQGGCPPCPPESECVSSQVFEPTCLQPCRNDAVCPPGQLCFDFLHTGGYCVAAPLIHACSPNPTYCSALGLTDAQPVCVDDKTSARYAAFSSADGVMICGAHLTACTNGCGPDGGTNGHCY
jgi:hypothetical protein